MSKVVDVFLFHDEFELLECRIDTMAPYVDQFVVLESDRTFQGREKPLYFKERYGGVGPCGADHVWNGGVKVRCMSVVTLRDVSSGDPWQREWAQRELARFALHDAPGDAVILNGDVDEIPTRAAVEEATERSKNGFVALDYRLYCFAVDWQYPTSLRGTLVGRHAHIESFAAMRRQRDLVPGVANAGFHFSWLGGKAAAMKKLDSFSHTELIDRVRPDIEADRLYREGYHVDGQKLRPVDVDATYPAYIRERRCPASWFRPRTSG